MRRKQFNFNKRDLSGVARWLRHRNLMPRQIADILDESANYVNVDLHRNDARERPVRVLHLLSSLDSRAAIAEQKTFFVPASDGYSVELSRDIQVREEELRTLERSVWKGVRYLRGTAELGRFLRKFSRPAADNIALLRQLGRAYHLESQTYSHGGFARSALFFGLNTYGTLEYVYRQTRSREDLEPLANAALVISNSLISRRDFERATKWLQVAEQVFSAISDVPNPELLRQQASVLRSKGNFEAAGNNLRRAADVLPVHQPDVSDAAISDMGDRVLFAISDTPNWDEARILFQNALRDWPVYDHHRSSTLTWTVACGLLTDSTKIHDEALELLGHYGEITDGFALQSTAAYLLGLTPRIPEDLRHEWVLFALSYNACRNE